MSRAFAVILIVATMTGCRDTDGPAPEIDGSAEESGQLNAEGKSDLWSGVSTQATLLQEDLNVIATADAEDPTFCHQLGHALGKAAVLGAFIERLLPISGLSTEAYSDIYSPASMMQVVKISPTDCEPNRAADLKTYADRLKAALQKHNP